MFNLYFQSILIILVAEFGPKLAYVSLSSSPFQFQSMSSSPPFDFNCIPSIESQPLMTLDDDSLLARQVGSHHSFSSHPSPTPVSTPIPRLLSLILCCYFSISLSLSFSHSWLVLLQEKERTSPPFQALSFLDRGSLAGLHRPPFLPGKCIFMSCGFLKLSLSFHDPMGFLVLLGLLING